MVIGDVDLVTLMNALGLVEGDIDRHMDVELYNAAAFNNAYEADSLVALIVAGPKIELVLR